MFLPKRFSLVLFTALLSISALSLAAEKTVFQPVGTSFGINEFILGQGVPEDTGLSSEPINKRIHFFVDGERINFASKKLKERRLPLGLESDIQQQARANLEVSEYSAAFYKVPIDHNDWIFEIHAIDNMVYSIRANKRYPDVREKDLYSALIRQLGEPDEEDRNGYHYLSDTKAKVRSLREVDIRKEQSEGDIVEYNVTFMISPDGNEVAITAELPKAYFKVVSEKQALLRSEFDRLVEKTLEEDANKKVDVAL